MSDFQQTISKPVTISGIGLHTGKPVTLTFKPSEINTGFRFQRIDLPEKTIIPADVDYVVDTSRGTTLEFQGVKVYTVEHVLAACMGMNLDNILMEVDGPEMPIMDGSSYPFVMALQEAGIETQNAIRKYFVVEENLTYEDTEKGIEMLAVPQDTFRITVMVDYRSKILGTQHASMYKMEEFNEDIAKCRTFVFLHELEPLFKNNLIKGGDLDNAIVLVAHPIAQNELDRLAEILDKPKMEIKGIGVLNNTELHFENEPARHKLLDIVGDLALVGI
jgi:UDP-3-O-[3-hydroxymyristoyl] N-acetylglucosamine deacetylase/3-hydroxyacyl-[acyl-carrier-protein] dehydratase